MAKRLSETGLAVKKRDGGRTVCRVCSGSIVTDEFQRDARFPRRRFCKRCGTEYGTTASPVRNY